MNNLPIELVGVVAENVCSTSDLLSLRSVNSTCHHLVTPLVFQKVHIRNSVQSTQKSLSILATPSLAVHVREVVYDQRDHAQFCFIPPGAHDICDEIELSELEDALTETFCALSGFKNLESIVLNFWPSFRSQSDSEVQEHPFWFTNRQVTVLHATHHAITNHPSSTIRSLELNNVVLLSSAHYDFVSSMTNTPLHHFSMSVVANSELGAWSGSKAVNGPLSALLPPPNANLRSLFLRSPQGLYHSVSTQLSARTYPALETLVLENIVFDHSYSPSAADGIEEFIVRHKASLRHLELHSCASYVPSVETPVRRWSDIWNRFGEELRCLTELEVSMSEGSDSDILLGGRGGYALLDGARGYLPHSPVSEEDEESYLRFSDSVKLRSISC